MDSGGPQVGSTQNRNAVTLTNGLLTVQLDFGDAVFNEGTDRWLEIAVRCPAGAGAFATLNPRQQLTAQPYALFSQTVANGSITGAKVVDGSLTTADIDFTTGNIDLADSTAGAGSILKNGTSFLHNTGPNNTFLGIEAGNFSVAGQANTALGRSALAAITSGDGNTALGTLALNNTSTGTDNIAVGVLAGSNIVGGARNIRIGNAGVAGDGGTIRIGDDQTSAYMAGIFGQTSSSGTAVFVNSAGKLGTFTSSRRYKDDIQDMGDTRNLLRLRPVSFRYKPDLDPSGTRQYGLIAEEVAEVLPELVVYDASGRPETVRYQLLEPMLLNEVQTQHRMLGAQAQEIAELKARLTVLEAAVVGMRP